MEQIKLDIRDIYNIFSNLIEDQKEMMQSYFKDKPFKFQVEESKINFEEMSYVSTVNQVYDLSKQKINNNDIDIEKIKENLTFFEKILDSKIIVDEANLDIHYSPQCSEHDIDEEQLDYKINKKIKKPKMKVYKFILRQLKKQLNWCENEQKYIESIIKIQKIHNQSLSQQKNNFTFVIKKLFANITQSYDYDKMKYGCEVEDEDERSPYCELSIDTKIEFRNTPTFQLDTLYLNFQEISWYDDYFSLQLLKFQNIIVMNSLQFQQKNLHNQKKYLKIYQYIQNKSGIEYLEKFGLIDYKLIKQHKSQKECQKLVNFLLNFIKSKFIIQI